MKEYRINIFKDEDTSGLIQIQCKGLLFWNTIWERRYSVGEEDYARRCAQEIVDRLEEWI